MFNLVYRETPLPPTNLSLGAAKMGKTSKPLLVARLPTRCEQLFYVLSCILREGITSKTPLYAFVGIWDCGWAVSIGLDTSIYCGL